MAHIETTYYVGQGPVTRFTARDEDGDVIVEGNTIKVDVAAEIDGKPYWTKTGLTGVFLDPALSWGLDSTGYNFSHRIPWGDADDYGATFEPDDGGTVDVYYFLRRPDADPVVVHHAVSIVHAPVILT